MAHQHAKVKEYIKANCASYDRDGLCFMETDSSGGRLCPMIYNLGKKCNYAETSVIPGDPEIEALYYAGKKDVDVKLTNCADCTKQYKRTSNRQIRCPECAKSKRNERQRNARLENSLKRYRSDD